jgi:hypothetical protein
MKTTGRSLLLVLALALALSACTGEEGGGSDGGGGGNGGTGPEPTPSDVVIEPGTSGVYRYANAGLVATLDLEAGTLQVENGTDRDLPKPGFYVLGALDGHQVDGRVEGAAPVPAGEAATFDVVLEGVRANDIGLVVLLMGRDNYGAFVQQ